VVIPYEKQVVILIGGKHHPMAKSLVEANIRESVSGRKEGKSGCKIGAVQLKNVIIAEACPTPIEGALSVKSRRCPGGGRDLLEKKGKTHHAENAINPLSRSAGPEGSLIRGPGAM